MKQVYRLGVFLLLFTVVVVPNSLKVLTAALLILLALSNGMIVFREPRIRFLLLCFLVGVFVTLFYLAVGVEGGAPAVAVEQVLIIYVVAPLLWVVVAVGIYRYVGLQRLVVYLSVMAFLACVSVALYFYLFSSFGPSAVGFFVDEDSANLDVESGYAAATMQVYGSLIFLCGAFFGSPYFIKNTLFRIFLLVSLLAAVFTSGRTALFLAIPIGFVSGFFVTLCENKGRFKIKEVKRSLRTLGILSCGVMVFAALFSIYTEVNLVLILERFSEHIATGGGVERGEQAAAIFEGILNTYGLGGGHGVGVQYLRSDIYPWRYELIWLVTVLRVGVLGTVIYTLPFIFYIVGVFRAAFLGFLGPSQKFMFNGFLAAFFASATNPYIESIVFQWMFVLPVVFGLLGRFRDGSESFDASKSGR